MSLKNKRMIFNGLVSTLAILMVPTVAQAGWLSIAVGGNRVVGAGKANTPEIARFKALNQCRNGNGRGCHEVYSNPGSGHVILAISKGGTLAIGTNGGSVKAATDEALSRCYDQSHYQARCSVLASFRN